MKTVAIIQARMGSTRLPGKVLKPLCGRPMLEHVVQRIRGCSEIDEVVVATTELLADQAIVTACRDYGVSCFCGSERDVLSRYRDAAERHRADIVIRITSDCPLIDPELIGDMLREFKTVKPDYMSNTVERTFPRGLDTEIFTIEALRTAGRDAQEPYEREHVTPHFYQHPEKFKIRSFKGSVDLSGYRWTVDTEEDFELIRGIYDGLGRGGKRFTTEETLAYLKEHPELRGINAGIVQKKLKGDS